MSNIMSVSVCVLGTRVSCAKTAEPIEMLFRDQLTWIQETVYQIGVHISLREGALLSIASAGPLYRSPRIMHVALFAIDKNITNDPKKTFQTSFQVFSK